jgi:hypothetical protein
VTPQKILILQKILRRNGYDYLERLRQTGPQAQSFELIRHTADPDAGPYPHEFLTTLPEVLAWVNGPEQVTSFEVVA